MDIFLLEAAINGLLLAGVLALLTLGLNLIFGVIDVVWIAYADLVMCGMYAVYWLFAVFGWPLPLAFAASVLGVAALGVVVHLLIIAPILSSAPINQLLATGKQVPLLRQRDQLGAVSRGRAHQPLGDFKVPCLLAGGVELYDGCAQKFLF